MSRTIIAGSRGSKLALIQTDYVLASLKELNPAIEVSVKKIATAGDRDRNTQLEKMGSAAFVKELEMALLDHRIDFAVHSLKDVPTDIPEGLHLLAVPERLDPRDVLIAGAAFNALAPGSRIGTGSLRRTVQIKNLRRDLEIRGIRGNIDTRLRKVYSGEFDGTIMAAAALLRLGWQDKITEYLPLEHFLPAAGQGALAIEARVDEPEIEALISPLNHLPSWRCTMAERAFLRTLGSGCRAPVAVLATINDSTLELKGMVADPASDRVLRGMELGDVSYSDEIGIRLAEKMLGMGASGFIGEAGSR